MVDPDCNGSHDAESYHLNPIFSKATSILFNTGNIMSSKRIKKKTSLQPNDEILECLQAIIHNWLPTIDRDEVQVRF
jgi:hypothetical protein